jgi:hypothetical protein
MIKTANPSVVTHAGEVITYTYDITSNLGNKYFFPLYGLSAMTIAVTDSPLDGPVVCEGMQPLWECTATYIVTEADIANGGVTNNAVVTGSFTSHEAKHNVTGTASATVKVNRLGLPPILTGDVTFCDPATRIINLRFVAGFDPQDFKHQVTMDGVGMVCEVNPSNKTLLSCKYPESAVFPAAIQVMLDGVVVNEFVFDGVICAGADQSGKPDDKGPVCVPLPGKVCP